MNEIKWKDEAVCFATNEQRYANDDAEYIVSNSDKTVSFNLSRAISSRDFQLNEIRQGDYIEASELDTEQKYNNAVAVFELFGFKPDTHHMGYSALIKYWVGLGVYEGVLASTNATDGRKITYQQLMAIGKLKRAMIERDSSKQVEQLNMESIEPVKQHKKSIDYLNECVEVQKQRGEQYDSKGTGERSFDAAAKAFNAMTGQNLKGSDVCLLLACVKAVRQYSDPTRVHEDSLLDLVSYVSLWAEEINKELK
jgi:hypothetical protein